MGQKATVKHGNRAGRCARADDRRDRILDVGGVDGLVRPVATLAASRQSEPFPESGTLQDLIRRRRHRKIVEMHDDAIRVDEDHGIGWRFMAQAPTLRKIERRLMIGAAQRADRNAAPTAGDRPVDMAGEDVADIAVA